MNYKKIADTAMLAGKIMLESNAETYRVEETAQHILSVAELDDCDTFVLPTGIMITLAGGDIEAITLTRRIKIRNTDLHKIHKVNDISRKLKCNQLCIDEAFQQLIAIDEQDYNQFQVNLAIITLAVAFTIMLGGHIGDTLVTLLNGIIFVTLTHLGKQLKIGLFFSNVIGSMAMAYFTTLLVLHFPSSLSLDSIMIGSIMPMLPGTIITNAIRDTFHGDYVSGVSRATEAIFIAVSIAIGVALGLMFAGGEGVIN